MNGHPATGRVLGVGIAAFVVLAALGAPWFVSRVERDVESRVQSLVAVAGVDGLAVRASGQDVELVCESTEPDVAQVRAVADEARSLRGVRDVGLDESCTADDPGEPAMAAGPSPTTVPATEPTSTTGAPATSLPTTDPTPTPNRPTTTGVTVASAGPAPSSTVAPAADWPRAALADGVVRLTGAVASAQQRQRLVAAAERAPAAVDVVDELAVDPELELDDLAVLAFEELVAVMPGNLTEAEATVAGTQLRLAGTVVDDEARATLTALARLVDATLDLSDRPAASADDVARVQRDLDDLLAEQPIRFRADTDVLVDGAADVLDLLAPVIARQAGVVVTVEGHTDTIGPASQNAELGAARADAVVAALVARGVPATQLVAVGVGEAEPVVVDGVEDFEASRRIVMVAALDDTTQDGET